MSFGDRTHPQRKETTEVVLFLNQSWVDQGFEYSCHRGGSRIFSKRGLQV